MYLNAFEYGGVAGKHGFGGSGTFKERFGPQPPTFAAGMWFKDGLFIGPMHYHPDFDTAVCGLFALGDGSFSFNVTGGPVYYSDVDLWRPGIWHFIEVEAVLDDASGSIDVYLDDPLHTSPIISSTGMTVTAGNIDPPSYWGGIIVAGLYDDLYVTVGSTDDYGNAFPASPSGPIEIIRIRPNGAGFKADWDPTPAVPNWQNVDEVTPDGDTTINEASYPAGIGDEDLHDFEPISTGDAVVSLNVRIVSRKSSDGGCQITPLVRHGGVTYDLAPFDPPVTFASRSVGLGAMPNADPLTDANINALMAGYRREA